MTQPTPGPWTLHKYHGHVSIQQTCGHENLIGTVGHSCKHDARDEQAANARLIAAAPKLQAIVEGFLGTLVTNDAYQVHRYYDTNIELFNLAIDTIQELRGE